MKEDQLARPGGGGGGGAITLERALLRAMYALIPAPGAHFLLSVRRPLHSRGQ